VGEEEEARAGWELEVLVLVLLVGQAVKRTLLLLAHAEAAGFKKKVWAIEWVSGNKQALNYPRP
jgi:hypothetical protein